MCIKTKLITIVHYRKKMAGRYSGMWDRIKVYNGLHWCRGHVYNVYMLEKLTHNAETVFMFENDTWWD